MRKSYVWTMWVSVAIAVSIGIIVTKNSACLWAFLIPAFITPFE